MNVLGPSSLRILHMIIVCGCLIVINLPKYNNRNRVLPEMEERRTSSVVAVDLIARNVALKAKEVNNFNPNHNMNVVQRYIYIYMYVCIHICI